jgi:hypothetical protein
VSAKADVLKERARSIDTQIALIFFIFSPDFWGDNAAALRRGPTFRSLDDAHHSRPVFLLQGFLHGIERGILT